MERGKILAQRFKKIALTIAGSDPTGGAGIQLDSKIFSSFGIFPLTAVTAITAQSSSKVTSVLPVPPDILDEQLKLLSMEFKIDAVKIGMLATAENVEVVSDFLKRNSGVKIISDPVLVSSSGMELLENEAIEKYCKKIIPYSNIVTPNIPEARIIAKDITESMTPEELAEKIKSLGPEGVLVKGGHSTGCEVCDTFLFEGKVYKLSSKRIEGDFHGTGCALSSAITSFLVKGYVPQDAVRYAREYLLAVLKHSLMFSLKTNVTILQIKKPFIKGLIKGSKS